MTFIECGAYGKSWPKVEHTLNKMVATSDGIGRWCHKNGCYRKRYLDIDQQREASNMSKNKFVLIISGIAFLLLIGSGYLLSRSSVNTLIPFSKPQLNQEALKEVMIFGASGTVGDGILKALLMDKTVQKVHVITRRLTPSINEGVKMGKVIVTKHMNYMDYSPLMEKLLRIKIVYWAIGTSARNVSDEEYTKIHVDFPVAFVKLWLSLNKEKYNSFHLITGAGTSADSWFHWAREKAKAEIQLSALVNGTGLRFIAYRPSFVITSAERITPFKSMFYTPLEFMNLAVKSTHIGQCMIEVTMREREIGNGSILNHSSIRNFAEVYRNRYELSTPP